MIGTQLAEDMGVGLGDKLRLNSAAGTSLILNIVGIFDLGSRAANQRNVYVLLSTAQNLLNMVGGVSSIELTVHDPYSAEDIAQSIANSIGLNALELDYHQQPVFPGDAGADLFQFIDPCFRCAVGGSGDRQCAGGV
jgi:ABC-type lipoprotein release transport system permease subunit